MAWGIIMTGLTLIGMLGLMVLGLSGQEDPTRVDSKGTASTVGARPRAA